MQTALEILELPTRCGCFHEVEKLGGFKAGCLAVVSTLVVGLGSDVVQGCGWHGVGVQQIDRVGVSEWGTSTLK